MFLGWRNERIRRWFIPRYYELIIGITLSIIIIVAIVIIIATLIIIAIIKLVDLRLVKILIEI